MTITNIEILAPEILAHFTAAPEIAVGDLVVVTDYAGREIGARVTHIMGGDVVARVCGLSDPRPYAIGDVISRPLTCVRKAI